MPKTLKKESKRKSSSKTAKAKVSKQLSKDKEILKSLEMQLEETKDKHLRLKAEFDNFRRRKADELSALLKYDGENIIKGFIPIMNDLDRMLGSSNATNESLKDGMKLVDVKIQKYLESLDVKSFGEVGDEMDAEIHEAMMTQTDESMDDHVILSVFEKGYTYRDKVIRHAKVIVNKK
ncbi:MAG TPA: nucleotide exchange factor GrpE [Candidatus Marinimicrobia bacterium]|nr:nucleotide exchange factor GrpE [Candidatus Neomarinimicrobiota bacterium]